jgi:predicted tellurium resistance membrane protein TerC
VITAVGLSNEIAVMIVAIVIAVIVMLAFSGALSQYIGKASVPSKFWHCRFCR